MGWARAGEIFDAVAQTLLDARVSDQVLDDALSTLASSLTELDWDTVDESVRHFAGHPVVQHALIKADGLQCLYAEDGEVEGYLDFHVRALGGGQWELTMRGERTSRPGTLEGFNELIDKWAAAGGTAAYAKAAAEYRLV